MLTQFTYQPPFPAPLIVFIAAMLALAAVAGYCRRLPGVRRLRRILLGALRLGALGILAWVLLRPMLDLPSPSFTTRPVFTILIDDSKSMATRDVDGRSRVQAIEKWMAADGAKIASALDEHFDVRLYGFSESIHPWRGFHGAISNVPTEGMRTDLASAMTSAAEAAAGRKNGGMLILSDGRENAGGDADGAAMRLRAMKIPVWTSTLGEDTAVKDIYVTASLSRNFLYIKQPASINAQIWQSGFEGQPVKVDLYREGKYVSSQQTMLQRGATKVDFPILEESGGLYQYRIEAQALEDEAVRENNRRAVFARVFDEKTRVLVVEGRPYWDSKFLLQTLRANPHLDVTSVFYINPGKIFAIRGVQDEDGGAPAPADSVVMPRTKEDLYQYDCIILGRDIDQAFSARELSLFRDYLVERGGGIIFARGRPSEQPSPELAKLEPVNWEERFIRDTRLELTQAGAGSPLFSFTSGGAPDLILRELPSMISVTKVREEKALAVVLARAKDGGTGEEVAVIAHQRYGKGRTMTIGATGLWRWAFMPEELARHDQVYKEFWNQTILWLTNESEFFPGQDITFKLNKYAYSLHEPVRLAIQTQMISTAQYRPVIQVHDPAGQITEITPATDPDDPSIYAAYFTPELEGEYSAVLRNNLGEPKEDRARFTAYSDAEETRFVAANADLMRRIAAVTGGEDLALPGLALLPEKAREFEQAAMERTKPIDAWDTPEIFFLIAGLLSMEWLLRRRVGWA